MSPDSLKAMRDSMLHRGPDDSGQLLDNGIAIGSRRLTILDMSSRGRMPMSTPDGRYHIVYNGEVYNFRELRAQLHDYTFRTDTDTEVVLAYYAQYQEDMLPYLNGMFACAIWDAETHTLFMARDRMGIKPLYFAEVNEGLWFASEEKAFFAGGMRPVFNDVCFEELVTFGSIAGAETPFMGIKRMLPGHWLRWEAGRITHRQWWRIADFAASETHLSDPDTWFRENFDLAVARRHIADVRVGTLLSGGLDSTSVAASLAKQFGRGVASFTMRFPDPDYDEGLLAAQAVMRWDLEQHAIYADTSDLIGQLRAGLWMNDEPFPFVNDLFLQQIAREASQHVTVLLSGEGGDETLCGYHRYYGLRNSRFTQLSYLLPDTLIPEATRFSDPRLWFVMYSTAKLRPKSMHRLGMLAAMDFPYRSKILQEAAEAYPGDTQRQAMYYDQHTFLSTLLHRGDRMLMSVSVEGRVPFLDHHLLEGLATLPDIGKGTQNKPLLRRAIGERLPPGLLNQHKRGFDVPWKDYIQQQAPLREWVRSVPDLPPFADSAFDRNQLHNIFTTFFETGYKYDGLVLQFSMIALWYDVFFNRVDFSSPA